MNVLQRTIRPELEAASAHDDAERIADLLWEVRHLLRDRLTEDMPAEQLAASIARYRLLGRVIADPGITVNELARRALMPRSRVSVLATELEAEGLLRKDPDGADRRLIRLTATAAGRRKREAWRSEYLSFVGSQIRHLPARTRRGLVEGLQALREVLVGEDGR
jgi:DNA-binding MarR family transcriptional regulator